MSDIEATTTSEEGYACTSQVGGYDLQIDASKETGPSANQTLVAAYASCYLPALRVGAQQRGVEDLGKVQIDSEADLDEDDDLTAIRWDLYVEADVEDDKLDEIVERGMEICHVHSALRPELHADVTAHADAF